MEFLPKLVFICLLLPLVSPSPEPMASAASNTSNKDNINKLSHKLLFEITIHGFLLWASMGFLMPVGILAIRMSNREECGRRLKILFHVHAFAQVFAVLLSTAGAVMSFKNFNNAFNNNHQRIGVALYGIIWLQALIGFLRPHRGSKGRSVWFFMHWILGTTVSFLGVLNIYTGLEAYHQKTSRGIKLWVTLFTAEVCFICFFYLFQDKWVYIQKQGVILGTESVRPSIDHLAPPKEMQKESIAMVSC
ncbi:hypothetical protein UlMin_022675 [Ulmus minor]